MNTAKTVAQLSTQATIGQIVSVSDTAESLLYSIGLKPEVHKEKTLSQVCTELKWNEEEVLEWIKHKNSGSANGSENKIESTDQFDKLCLAERTVYIYTTYHNTIFELMYDVNQTLPRVYQVHGIQDPVIKILEQEFESFSERLLLHLKFQRNRFFKQIQKYEAERSEVSDGVVQGLKKSVGIIRDDQKELNKKMDTFERITNHFRLPEYACSTYRILMKSLEVLVGGVREMNIDIENGLNQPICKILKLN